MSLNDISKEHPSFFLKNAQLITLELEHYFQFARFSFKIIIFVIKQFSTGKFLSLIICLNKWSVYVFFFIVRMKTWIIRICSIKIFKSYNITGISSNLWKNKRRKFTTDSQALQVGFIWVLCVSFYISELYMRLSHPNRACMLCENFRGREKYVSARINISILFWKKLMKKGCFFLFERCVFSIINACGVISRECLDPVEAQRGRRD